MSSQSKTKAQSKSSAVFSSGASFQHNERGSKSARAVNKQGVLDFAKAMKEKSAKGQKSKFQKAFSDVDQQRAAAVNSRMRGNKIEDRRNLDATEAQLKQALYKQKQQQLRQKKSQSGKFNLGDEGAADYEQSLSSRDLLTHGGKAVKELSQAELRAYGKDGSDSDSDFHQISREETRAHFGGGVLTGEHARLSRLSREEWQQLTVPERYKFLLQMSKQERADRKGKKSVDEKLLVDLDLDFDNIRDLLDFSRDDDDEDEYLEIDQAGRFRSATTAPPVPNQPQGEYMTDMLAKYGIAATGEDDEKTGSEDDSDEDSDSDEADSEDANDSDEGSVHSKLRSAICVEEEDDDEKTAKAFQQKVAASHQKLSLSYEEDLGWDRSMQSSSSKIGLDGKSIASNSGLKFGLAIGANTSRDDYLAQAHTLQRQARVSAGSRLVGDQEKAEKHRNYLLYLEQKRIKRKNGELGENDEDDDELARQYENLFTTRHGKRRLDAKEEDELVVKAMMDGDEKDDDYDVDISTGLQINKKDMTDEDSDEDDDEDDEDEDDQDSEDDSRPTSFTGRSGDSLDQDFVLDDEVDGIDYNDYDDEEIELMSTGGETKALLSSKDKRNTNNYNNKRQESRRERKNDLGMFVNDIDTILQPYYLSTRNEQYRVFIAKMKVTIRDEIPYNYEFPNQFNTFITMLYNHIVPIVSTYTAEYKKVASIVTTLQKEEAQFSLLTEANLRGHICSLIIGRIFQLYHPRISTSNEVKIEILYRLLWRLLKIITTQYQQLEAAKQSNQILSKAYIASTLYDVLAISDVITSYLFTINELLPRYTGRACIGLMEFFAESSKAPHLGAVLPEKDHEDRQICIQSIRWGKQVVTTLPDVHELFAYKVLMHLYPLSDARHTIITPLQMLLSQLATQSYILSNIDMVKSMFIMGLLLEIWRNNDRLVPECFATIQSMLAVMSNSYLQNQDQRIVHNLQQMKEQEEEAAVSKQQKIELAKAAEDARKANKTANTSISTTSATDIGSILSNAANSANATTKGKKGETVKNVRDDSTAESSLLSHLQSTGKTSETKVAGEEFVYKPTPVILEAWREHKCAINPTSLSSLSELPSQLSHIDSRSTGILPLQWLFVTPNSLSQTSTEHFRVVMITTLCSFLRTLSLRAKSHTSCNELLSPLIETLQLLTSTVQLFISNLPNTTTKPKAKKGAKAASLLDSSSHLSDYNKLLSTITETTTFLQSTAQASLIGRKPLEKYAAVIVPKELEPRLDMDEKWVDPRRQSAERQLKERKRLEKELTEQKKQLRKNVRKHATTERVEQQRTNQIKDDQRKSQLARARSIVQGDAQGGNHYNKNFKKTRH